LTQSCTCLQGKIILNECGGQWKIINFMLQLLLVSKYYTHATAAIYEGKKVHIHFSFKAV